jgi:hypothetical protein
MAISCGQTMYRLECTLVQALRLCTGCTAYRRSRGIALLFHDHGTRRGWGVSVTPRPLFTPGKDPVPIVQEAGWPQGRSEQVWKISPPPGFDPQTVQPVASRYTNYTNWPTDIEDLHEILFLENPNLVKVVQTFRMMIQACLILLSAPSVAQQ